MRVLWFTGVQFPALSRQGVTRAGWQEGLRKALETYHPEIELGIVNFGPESAGPLVQGNATYYTLPRKTPRGKLSRAAANWRHVTYAPEDLDRAVEMVDRFQPDLVHFHGTENPYGLIAGRIRPASVLSLQAILNGLQPFQFTDAGPRDLLPLIPTRIFARGEGPLHRWWRIKKYLGVEQEIFRVCRNYIGRTGWDRAMLSNLNPAACYFHCDEALADGYYQAEWRPAPAARPVIYTTTTDAFFKGSLTLARAVAIMKSRGWKDVQLRLAGTGGRSYVGKAVTRLAKEAGLEENIVWLDRLTPEQITAEMLAAGVYVHASHMDNSPNSLCEAMLAGMPCVAAFAGGVPSLITDEVNGLLYPDRDPYLLAGKVIRLLDDRELAARLGAAARRTALERHDRRRIADRTVEIYAHVAGSRSPLPAEG